MLFEAFWRICIFIENGLTQSLHSWSNFDFLFPPEDGRNQEGEQGYGNTSDLGLSKYAKIKALSPFPFGGKIRLLYALFGLFLEGSRAGRKIRESESNFDISFFTHAIPGKLFVKKLWFQHFPVSLLPITKDTSEKFHLDFQVCMLFLVQGLHFWKKKQLDFLMQNLMLNQLAPNPKNEKPKILYSFF